MDEALTQLHTLLKAGGIAHEPFVADLTKHKITPEMFLTRLQAATKQTEIMQPQMALGLRALHLESGNPVKLYNMLGHIATLGDMEASLLKKTGAAISSIGNGRNLVKHFTGSGFGTLFKNAASLGTTFLDSTPSEKKFAWPKFTKTPNPEALSEQVMRTAENVLKNFKPGRNKSGTQHLAQFFDLSEQSVGGIVEAAQNLLKNPQSRESLKNAVKSRLLKMPADALKTPEIYTVLNEVLTAVGKFHNPADTKRMADVISIMMNGEKDMTPLARLAEYWEAGKKPLVEITEEAPELATAVEKTISAAKKIAFTNRPAVSLGAAALAMGSAVLVGNKFAKGHEQTNETMAEDGTKTIHTKTIPAGFWAKTAKFVGVSALLTACGVAGVRAVAMPNQNGISFVEKMLAGGARTLSRA